MSRCGSWSCLHNVQMRCGRLQGPGNRTLSHNQIFFRHAQHVRTNPETRARIDLGDRSCENVSNQHLYKEVVVHTSIADRMARSCSCWRRLSDELKVVRRLSDMFGNARKLILMLFCRPCTVSEHWRFLARTISMSRDRHLDVNIDT